MLRGRKMAGLTIVDLERGQHKVERRHEGFESRSASPVSKYALQWQTEYAASWTSTLESVREPRSKLDGSRKALNKFDGAILAATSGKAGCSRLAHRILKDFAERVVVYD